MHSDAFGCIRMHSDAFRCIPTLSESFRKFKNYFDKIGLPFEKILISLGLNPDKKVFKTFGRFFRSFVRSNFFRDVDSGAAIFLVRPCENCENPSYRRDCSAI